MPSLEHLRSTSMIRYFWNLVRPIAQLLPAHPDGAVSGDRVDSREEFDAEQEIPPYRAFPEGTELRFLAEQAIRDQQYISFSQEDETDYTDGPARMVDASDGIKTCVALLMTFELSRKILRVLDKQDKYIKQDQKAKQELASVRRFQSKLKTQVLRHETRIAAWQAGPSETDVGDTALRRIQYELDMLRLLQENMTAEEQIINVNLTAMADQFHQAQLDVNEYLADAFMVAKLFTPDSPEPDRPVSEYDLQTEYAKLLAEVEAEYGQQEFNQPLNTSTDFMRAKTPELSPEEQARDTIQETLWHAKNRFETAQEQFNGREKDRFREEHLRKAARSKGEAAAADSTEEAFDLRWVLRNQELTRELREAEEGLAQAQAEAEEAGIGVSGAEQVSCFASDPEDGALLSHDPEAPEKARADPRVRQWLELASDQDMAAEERVADMDDWDARDIAFGESVEMTVFAEEPMRSKIDEWQQKCEKAFV